MVVSAGDEEQNRGLVCNPSTNGRGRRKSKGSSWKRIGQCRVSALQEVEGCGSGEKLTNAT